MKTLIRLFASEEGATAIEYGLIATLISLACIAGMTLLGGSLANTFAAINADFR